MPANSIKGALTIMHSRSLASKAVRSFLALLPRRVAASLYHRVFRRCQHLLPDLFMHAPLQHFPAVVMDLKSTDVAHGEIAFLGVYEKDLADALAGHASASGGTLLDVGANYGYFSLLWCAASPHNNAIAVEASKSNVDALRKNIQLNGLEDRIKVCEFAATDRDGPVHFTPGPPQQTGWGGIVTGSTPDGETLQGRRLDDHLGNLKIAVTKIDCEGADALVLRGLSNLLQNRAIEHLYFEDNPYRASALDLHTEDAITLLTRCGYTVEAFNSAQAEDAPREYHAHLATDQTASQAPV